MPAVEIRVEALERDILGGVPDPTGETERVVPDVGLVPLFSDERPLTGWAGYLDWRWCGRLSSLVREGMCTGEMGEAVLVPGQPSLAVERVVVVGLGESEAFDEEVAQEAGRTLVRVARRLLAADVALSLPTSMLPRSATETLFGALVTALEDVVETGSESSLPEQRWWVVAADRQVARLRRLLEGPPRPAESV